MAQDRTNDSAEPVTDPEFGPWLAQASILIVDDEPGIRNFLVKILLPRCKLIEVAADTKEASRKLDEQNFDVVILDNIMPGQNGLDWLAEQRTIGFFADVILMTAYADLDTAIGALRAGVVDFILKPFRSNQLLNAVARCLDRMRLQRENEVLRQELKSPSHQIFLRNKLLGESKAIQHVRETIARVAPLPTSVLLTGKSGTGKEVAARSLHSLSNRSDKLFVPINCGAIPADMIESELFGHLKGAFTGAGRAREGLFMHAHGGTVFLDEIGELPYALQTKLLRVLEDRRVRPVGSEREVPFDARFVFATNADLPKRVEAGAFRADLYFRINVMQIHLPPLKDRGDDVVELATLFMREFAQQLGMPPIAIDDRVRASLARYDWPGNIRELRNLIERTVILGGFPEDIERVADDDDSHSGGHSLAEIERRHILSVLREVGGDREEAARRLGISRKTVDRKCVSWHV
ncbi:sigma-54-dependent Fis family transcriptional regulator [Agrobacterium rhizogenes]|jgi:DNA-binding NtrC family response regulator|uniref:sigma-54-dependent transcriptional regulator n=1 Tax=Rhizobium rhizogenes TaxID=359 RepID=UPI0004D67F20|nr:sigma-54 dependent transcriptional regulator [Rhizobium rhizogenes]OCI96037.1 sigma-54-dependent Fis family transcriptional regulator [Agrobacterium sp. 13-626]OCJ23142.1 sigma-54-dependent Fis family transcriptional regulator [Agrobacterium sp. B133/95]KEA08339.1 Fis family transcriptional regulator [Rhizobium rhizogenes]MQB31386.1 sigma-54-dependent Fis family transcriptional regulator [Rhizobium rhizogenes]NTF51191.1 sigma-54-dependent Fis family transcriptional regulator [Rhizobium rhiz